MTQPNAKITFLLSLGCIFIRCAQEDTMEWPIYHGDNQASHHSSLDQINTANVDQLQVAWIWEARDMSENTTIQCNPLYVNDMLYVISPGLDLVALQPVDGTEQWRFRPGDAAGSGGNSRGVTYWSRGPHKRLFYAHGSKLFALNADNGAICSDFGDSGQVDLHTGLDSIHAHLWVSATTPGIIYEDLIIMGSRVGEGPGLTAPGHIRAFDVHDGSLVWRFRTIPRVTDSEAATWSAEHLGTMGGANSWAGFSLDEDRGLVFCGTGSASYDHWGGNRIGENLYANCVLALNAATGEKVWHQQLVHHDIWDYDVPCQPNLVQVKHEGKIVDAVAQPTKMGHLFLFERTTGEPLHPIEERKVAQSTIPGEQTWPTQPFPPPGLRYAVQSLQDDWQARWSAEAYQKNIAATRNFKSSHLFDPPGIDSTLVLPQFNGGTDWGGAAYNPRTRTLFVNCSNVAEWIQMKPNILPEQMSQVTLGESLYRMHCQNCHEDHQNQAPTLSDLSILSNSRDAFSTTVRHGKGMMPAFATMSTDELAALHNFLYRPEADQILKVAELDLPSYRIIPWLATGHHELEDEEGYPVNVPPWGTLTAIDLDAREIRWQSTLGTYPELESRGLPPTGTFNMGGPITTNGGLLFIGATMDERFRALDQETGKVLWEYQLNAGAYNTPSTYMHDGKQYVLVGAGGGGKPGTRSGDRFYCFSL